MREFKAIRYTPSVGDATNPEPYNYQAFQSGLDELKGILLSMIDEISQYGLKMDSAIPDDAIASILHICKRFHVVARQLESRHDNRDSLKIKDEYDVQDLLHALLKLYFDDVRPEDPMKKHAGASSRVDFILKKEQIGIEVKKTRPNLNAASIGGQLIIDRDRYQAHQDCKALIFFVYDPDHHIKNPHELETDLNGKHNDIEVLVIIEPK